MYFLVFLVLCDSKLNIFGIWKCHCELWRWNNFPDQMINRENSQQIRLIKQQVITGCRPFSPLQGMTTGWPCSDIFFYEPQPHPHCRCCTPLRKQMRHRNMQTSLQQVQNGAGQNKVSQYKEISSSGIFLKGKQTWMRRGVSQTNRFLMWAVFRTWHSLCLGGATFQSSPL